MINDDEFSELVLLWDRREQANSESRTRVERIIKWFQERGGTMIEAKSLPLTDYHIGGGFDEETKKFLSGTFRGKEINLGIEYKTMQDYSGSGADLDWKLVEAYQYFNQVALFVEEGNIGLSFIDGKTFIKNSAVPNGKADVLVYEHYKNEIDRFSQIADIHVRTFPYESFIDVNLDSLMILLSEEPKVRLYCRGNGKDDLRAAFITFLVSIPKVGIKTAYKLSEVYPNLEQFASHAVFEGEYEKIAGDLTGKKIRNFILDKSRIDHCMINYQALFNVTPKAKLSGLHRGYGVIESVVEKQQSLVKSHPEQPYDILQCPYLTKGGVFVDCSEVNAYQCIGFSCQHHPDHLKFQTSQSPRDPAGAIFNNLPNRLGNPADDNSKGLRSSSVGVPAESHSDADSRKAETTEPNNTPDIPPEGKFKDGQLEPLPSGGSSSHQPDSTTPPQIFKSGDDQGVVSPIPAGVRDSTTVLSDNNPSSLTESEKHHLNESMKVNDNLMKKLAGTGSVIKSLGDAIVDFCYEKPMTDFEILSAFQMKGYPMPEIHKALKILEKTKLRKSKRKGEHIYNYNGIKATFEMDVGV